jgi:integrase
LFWHLSPDATKCHTKPSQWIYHGFTQALVATLRITKSVADSARPRSKPYQLHDKQIGGLILRVQPTGYKAWYFEYRLPNGIKKRKRLGAYSRLSVEGARTLAKRDAGEASKGVDVQAVKQAERAEAERAKVATLKTFIEGRYGPWAIEHLRRGDVAVARLKADFKKWLEEPMSSFNTWRMESWRRDRLAKGAKPNTTNRQLDTLRSCLRKAVEWGVLDKHPMIGFKRLKIDDDERVRYLTVEEEARLRTALTGRETRLREARDRFNEWREARGHKPLPKRTAEYVDHIRPLTLLALNTGLRRGELFSLRWGDINLSDSMLVVRAAAAKSGDSRRVPLNTEALAVLTSWKAQQRPKDADELVFPGDDGKRLTRMDKAWSAVCTAAQLADFRFHDCRHHFASRLVQAGVDLNVVRELLGHANLEMTLRYSHLRPENLATAVAKLAAAT